MLNVALQGVPEGEEREKGPEEIFEKILIIAGNVSNMGKEIVTQDQALREAQAG